MALRSGFYYAIAAVPLMVAGVFGPDVFHLSQSAKECAFYLCLAAAVILVVIGGVKEYEAESKEPRVFGYRRRMLALIGMIGFGLGFLGSVAVYFWPRQTPPVATAAAAMPEIKTPWKHNLEDLYKTDFNLLALGRDVTATIAKSLNDPEAVTITMKFNIYQDFNAGAEFISIFIPLSNNIKIDGQIYDMIRLMRDDIQKNYNEIKASVGTSMGGRGASYTESKELKFSGRVFVYTMKNFTPIQIGDLMKWYQEASLSLQIRGYEYWWANKDR